MSASLLLQTLGSNLIGGTMMAFRARYLLYAIGITAGLLCGAAILVPVYELVRWGAATRGASTPAATLPGAKWVQLRGLVPAPIAVFVPTWLPADLRAISPSYTTGGGARSWTYGVGYSDDRLRGDRPYLVFTEETRTPHCAAPPCLQGGLGAKQPLPPRVGRALPHAELFVSRHAPEFVLRWRLGAHGYSIEAHGESRAAVLQVAVSLRPWYLGVRQHHGR